MPKRDGQKKFDNEVEAMKRKLIEAKKRIPADLFHRANSIRQIYLSRITHAAFADDKLRVSTAELIKELMQEIWDAKGNFRKEISSSGGIAKAAKLQKAKDDIRLAWASGKYTSRDICAEQEYSSLGFNSFKAARNALINTPPPRLAKNK